MKKIILLAIIVISTSFASCRKTYTCNCTNGYYSETYSSGTKIKKSTAESWCSSYESSYGYTCTLN